MERGKSWLFYIWDTTWTKLLDITPHIFLLKSPGKNFLSIQILKFMKLTLLIDSIPLYVLVFSLLAILKSCSLPWLVPANWLVEPVLYPDPNLWLGSLLSLTNNFLWKIKIKWATHIRMSVILLYIYYCSRVDYPIHLKSHSLALQ